jgi:hypothetical protein
MYIYTHTHTHTHTGPACCKNKKVVAGGSGFLMEKVHTYDADASEKYVCPN